MAKEYRKIGKIFKRLVQLNYRGEDLSNALQDEITQDQKLNSIFSMAQQEANNYVNQEPFHLNTTICEAGREIDSLHFLLIGTDCGGEEIIVGPGLYAGAQVSAKVCISRGYFKGVGVAVDVAPLVGVGAAAYIGQGFCLRLSVGFGVGARAGIGWMDI